MDDTLGSGWIESPQGQGADGTRSDDLGIRGHGLIRLYSSTMVTILAATGTGGNSNFCDEITRNQLFNVYSHFADSGG